MELSDILIEPDMSGISATDFFSSKTIIKRGEEATRKLSAELKNLVDSLNLEFHPVEKPEGPAFIYISDVKAENLRYVEESFVIGQGNIFPGTYTNKKLIERAVERIYGTRYFRKVGYRLEHIEGMKYRLIYMTEESSRAHLKFAPHYNNQQGTGIIMNTTFRNFLVPSSRIKLTANIAENPGAELVAQKYFGKTQQLIGYQFLYWNRSKLPVFYEGEEVGNYRHGLLQGGLGTRYSLNFNHQVGFDFYYERNSVKPGGAVETFYPQADFKNYAYGGFAYKGYYNINTLNDLYFATEGTKFGVGFKRVMKPLSSVRIEGDESLDEEIFNLALEPFNSFDANIDQYFRIPGNSSIQIGSAMGFSSEETPITNHFALGGILYTNRYKYETFYGLHFGEQIVANFMKVNAGIHYQLFPRVFISAVGNIAVTANDFNRFMGDFGAWKSRDYLKGYAAGIRLNSFLGPIILMVGDNSMDGSPRWYVSSGHMF